MDDLVLGVDPFHSADAVQVARGGLFENHIAVIRVAAVLRLARFVGQSLNHFGKSHLIGLAHAQVDDLGARVGCQSGPLGSLDLFELVDGGGLAVLASANALGKQVLNIGISHSDHESGAERSGMSQWRQALRQHRQHRTTHRSSPALSHRPGGHRE